MKIRINGGTPLKGEVRIPPSKSLSHRVLIASALCATPNTVGPIMTSDDTDATMKILEAFGASFHPHNMQKQYYDVDNFKMKRYYTQREAFIEEPLNLMCKESGSTLRFMIPFSFLARETTFHGEGRLVERPLTPYYTLFDEQGVSYRHTEGQLPLTVMGGLKSGVFKIPGDISSQFVTGLLMALPLLDGDSEVQVLPPFESKPYVDLTLSVLEAFGIRVEAVSDLVYKIKGRQRYEVPKAHYEVEGDYSQAAFFLVANALGSEVTLEGLSPSSKQGDRIIEAYLSHYNWKANETRRLSVKDCPDLLPILSVLAAASDGVTTFVEGERVRLKESDRIHAMAVELTKMGVRLEEHPDGLTVYGGKGLKGATVSAWADHRIAMALAIASTCAEGEVTIEGAECVAKSYPDFWSIFKGLGGDSYEQ